MSKNRWAVTFLSPCNL